MLDCELRPGNQHCQRETPNFIRRDQWKLLCFNGVPQELFNIKTDPLEKISLLKNHPELVGSLKKELDAWLTEPRLSIF